MSKARTTFGIVLGVLALAGAAVMLATSHDAQQTKLADRSVTSPQR